MPRSTRLNYYELEGFRLGQRPKTTLLKRLAASCFRIWASLGSGLLAATAPSGEPRIRPRFNRHGERYFAIYDPSTDQHVTCSSEAEVRRWIEQRYRR